MVKPSRVIQLWSMLKMRAGAVQHRLVAARPVRPGLRALDRDRRAGGAVAHGGRLLAVDAGREVDRGAGGRLLQRRLDRRQRRRGRGAVVGVAPVRADVERRLRGDRCGTRRRRHAAVLRRPVEDNDGQDGEHRHDDRGQYADHHGASRAACGWSGVGPILMRSSVPSCDVPWRVRAGRRARCDRKASMGPVTPAPSLGEQPGSGVGGPTARRTGPRPRGAADGAPRTAPHQPRFATGSDPDARNADDEAAEGFTLTWHHTQSRYTASTDLQRADRAARTARRVLVVACYDRQSSGRGCSAVHAQ